MALSKIFGGAFLKKWNSDWVFFKRCSTGSASFDRFNVNGVILVSLLLTFKSICPQVFCRTAVLKIFANCSKKQERWRHFSWKVAWLAWKICCCDSSWIRRNFTKQFYHIIPGNLLWLFPIRQFTCPNSTMETTK